jgi:hypothetical protein
MNKHLHTSETPISPNDTDSFIVERDEAVAVSGDR